MVQRMQHTPSCRDHATWFRVSRRHAIDFFEDAAVILLLCGILVGGGLWFLIGDVRNILAHTRAGDPFAPSEQFALWVSVATGGLASAYALLAMGQWQPVLTIAVIVTLLTMLPLWVPTLQTRKTVESAATVLLGLLVVLGGFSIGLFYLPAALAMLAATYVAHQRVNQPA